MRVKKGSEEKCGNYEYNNGSFVRVIGVYSSGDLSYEILNDKKEIVGVCGLCFKAEELEPLEKTFKTLEVGDVVKGSFGTRTVLAVLHHGNDHEESVYVLSIPGVENSVDTAVTSHQIESIGYTIVQDEPAKPEPKKMTVSEIAKALGHEVEVVKE